MRVGIVGSRRRKDKQNVVDLVNSLNPEDIVVSGACRGVDLWAEEAAKARGLKTLIFPPHLREAKTRLEVIQQYYKRNLKIAKNSDIIYAFVAEDRKGGTENTIEHAKKLKVKVVLK